MGNEPIILYPGSFNEMSFQCTECKGIYKIKWEHGEFIITCGCDKTQGVRIKLTELRPEPPPPSDRGTADVEKLESAINEAYCREGDDSVPLVRDLLQAALSAARGNRAELEAAAREVLQKVTLVEYCDTATKENVDEYREARDTLAVLLEVKE